MRLKHASQEPSNDLENHTSEGRRTSRLRVCGSKNVPTNQIKVHDLESFSALPDAGDTNFPPYKSSALIAEVPRLSATSTTTLNNDRATRGQRTGSKVRGFEQKTRDSPKECVKPWSSHQHASQDGNPGLKDSYLGLQGTIPYLVHQEHVGDKT